MRGRGQREGVLEGRGWGRKEYDPRSAGRSQIVLGDYKEVAPVIRGGVRTTVRVTSPPGGRSSIQLG